MNSMYVQTLADTCCGDIAFLMDQPASHKTVRELRLVREVYSRLCLPDVTDTVANHLVSLIPENLGEAS